MKNIYLELPEDEKLMSELSLATVTSTQGSTPQKPGSSAVFSGKGLLHGTIGGGIVEKRVQVAALEALKSKKSYHFTYDLYNDISQTEEAICGGRISVLIDAAPENSISVFRQLTESVRRGLPGVLVTRVTEGDNSYVDVERYWVNSQSDKTVQPEFIEKIGLAVNEQLTSGNRYDFREIILSAPDKGSSSIVFLEPVFPPCHLVIAGAGHIGKSLAHLGNILDFEVTVVDDRPEYANKENIPDADHIIVGDIGGVMKGIRKTEDTFVVIVTRGHKDDAEALKPCIGSGLAYTGMIGSKKKVNSIKEKFMESGWATPEQWEAIYSPIGIDIGSQTVEEIAVSIAAELIQVRNGNRRPVAGSQ